MRSGPFTHTYTFTTEPKNNFPHETEASFDAIVIGFGYGGSVSAYRLAKAGLRVAVIESEAMLIRLPSNFVRPSLAVEPCRRPVRPAHSYALEQDCYGLDWYCRWWRLDCQCGGNDSQQTTSRTGLATSPLLLSQPYYDRAEAMLGAKTYPLLSQSRLTPAP